MTARPCIDCGQVADGTRCPPCAALREQPRDRRRGTPVQRGYDTTWRRLRARAIRAHPWCTDCGTRTDLTGDHLCWPARTLADVEVVCRPCNSRRGPRRASTRTTTILGAIPPVNRGLDTRGGATIPVTSIAPNVGGQHG